MGADSDLGGGASALILGWELQQAVERRDAAEARLLGIRSLLAEMEPALPALLPDGAVRWKSRAAARYVGRLGGLHECAAALLAALRSAQASAWQELLAHGQACAELESRLRGGRS